MPSRSPYPPELIQVEDVGREQLGGNAAREILEPLADPAAM